MVCYEIFLYLAKVVRHLRDAILVFLFWLDVFFFASYKGINLFYQLSREKYISCYTPQRGLAILKMVLTHFNSHCSAFMNYMPITMLESQKNKKGHNIHSICMCSLCIREHVRMFLTIALVTVCC